MNSSRRTPGRSAIHGAPAFARVVAGERQVELAELLDLVGEVGRAHPDVGFGIGQQARRVRQLELARASAAPSAA